MEVITNFFNHPFFVIFGGIATVIGLVLGFYGVYLWMKGVLPVIIRLGKGLSKREIAILSDSENYNNLKHILVDSKMFKEENITNIDKTSFKKAENYTLMLMHWKSFENQLDKILDLKKDSDVLIIYAPHEDGRIENKEMKQINEHRNTLVVNFRGRLLNDILVSMMTSSYK